MREAAYLADVIFVMSARPGRILATHRINLPRPRTLDMTYEPEFVAILQEIRREIAQARNDGRGIAAQAVAAPAKVTAS